MPGLEVLAIDRVVKEGKCTYKEGCRERGRGGLWRHAPVCGMG